MNPPGPIALRAMREAVANLGVHEEGGANCGKYVEIYLQSVGLGAGNPWCAAFVYFRLKSAADALRKTLPIGVPRSGYTPDWAHWAKGEGRWMDAKNKPVDVQAGDLVLFYKPQLGRIGHIGIVTGKLVDDDKRVLGVRTVEGNTNAAGSREGDGVYAKARKWSELGTFGGFVRLDF